MTAKDIFSKTMPFAWAKLLLGLATVVISAVLFAILMGIGWLFGENGMLIMLLIWLGATGFIRFAIMHYMGYLVKAGHVAVIAEAFRTGRVSDNQVAVGKAMVMERFATSNVYFVIDKLVAGAVKQLQNALQKVGNALDFIPGMGAVTGLAQFFVSISLGYIDECCLGWTFYKKEQGPFQSAADGVVIYAQNWKVILGSAAKTMVSVLLLMAGTILAAFIPVGLLFKLLHWSPLVAFLLACLIAWAVKFAFIDSWIMVKMMASYMEVAPSTQITFDLYGKLCGLSSKFKELFQKGRQETPVAATASASAGAAPAGSPPAASAPQSASKPVYCGQCGAKNQPGTKFCGGCGAKLG